jgi:glycosyltransferase involved in cell wall biosynthesis
LKISVVTVAYNAAATIGHVLESFAAQDHRDSELILVDGDSSDDTVAIARQFADPRIRIVSEPDNGIYDAMNKGFGLYSGGAVGFLNSDDRFHDSNALSAIAEGLAGADIGRGWMAAHPTLYIRRNVAEAVGGFDENLRISADYDFMLRCFETQGFISRRIDRVLVDMLAGGASQGGIGAYMRGNLESLRARRKWLGAGPVDFALIAKPARKVVQWF